MGMTKYMNEKEKSEEYINDLKQWQDKMYSPGEYLGGKLTPFIKYGNRKVVKGYAWFIIIILTLVVIITVLNILNIL